MVQPIASSPIQPRATATPAAALAPSGAAYRADWAAPATTGSSPPAAAAGVKFGRSIAPSTARTQESALLAADVYRDIATPPAGFRVASAGDLAALGIKPQQLEVPGSSFRARVYATGDGADTRYVVAFRGSSAGEDWRNNFQQALGQDSQSYAKALVIGQQLARSDASVTLTGHSLGGGLASAAAVASGREADTFNAAGLSGRTLDAARAIDRASGGSGNVAVQAYQVPGEILSFLQDGGDRAIGFVLLGPVGAVLADAPPAYGNRQTLPEAVPDGKSWFDAHSRIDRHMIDWVLAGAAALR